MRSFERLFLAGQVTRYHTVPSIKTQTLAAHQWGVAMIVCRICPPESPELKLRLVEAALTHDLHEIETGDIPYTYKQGNDDLLDVLERQERHFNQLYGLPGASKFTHKEEQILKWADMLELVLWSQEEINLGNNNYNIINKRGRIAMDRIGIPTTEAKRLYDEIFS